MTPRTVQGTRYGAQPEAPARDKRERLDRRNKAYIALRVPPALLERIKAQMRATGETKQDVCIAAIEKGLSDER